MTPDTISSQRLDLELMTAPVMEHLLAREIDEAERLLDCTIPEDWPDEDIDRFFEMRLRQAQDHPNDVHWLARALVLRDEERVMVGHAGFHGPPEKGRVEFGYTVFPQYRGKGYALEASRALMKWAREEQGVRLFRASARPDNLPSLRIIDDLGFEQTGTQIDEIDGLELVFELDT